MSIVTNAHPAVEVVVIPWLTPSCLPHPLQGVGKNKLVDRLLECLNAEREYMQLHRDTTLHSLTVVPNLVDGRLVYEDSRLVRAVKHGRILVVDEADKAPLEVVALLKGLLEDGEMLLGDGRRLLSPERVSTRFTLLLLLLQTDQFACADVSRSSIIHMREIEKGSSQSTLISGCGP